jgi:hypothetical protein
VIRQAISCDICGLEKKQAKHWFVAYDRDGELRVSGWSSTNKLRPGAKHLCGQTCLHKLLDEFMAKDRTEAVEERIQVARPAEMEAARPPRPVLENRDTSLTSDAAWVDEYESSARLLPTPVAPPAPAASLPRPSLLRPPTEMPPAAARISAPEPEPTPADEPRFASRNWRAEAWEREREREQEHTPPRHSGIIARRRFNG